MFSFYLIKFGAPMAPPVLRRSARRKWRVQNLHTVNMSSVASYRGLAIKTDVSDTSSRAAVRRALIHVGSP